jgi:hypothetical protein
MRLLLLILLVMLLIGTLPVWPYAASWGVGYYPSGMFGLVLLVVLFLALTGGSRGAPPI